MATTLRDWLEEEEEDEQSTAFPSASPIVRPTANSSTGQGSGVLHDQAAPVSAPPATNVPDNVPPPSTLDQWMRNTTFADPNPPTEGQQFGQPADLLDQWMNEQTAQRPPPVPAVPEQQPLAAPEQAPQQSVAATPSTPSDLLNQWLNNQGSQPPVPTQPTPEPPVPAPPAQPTPAQPTSTQAEQRTSYAVPHVFKGDMEVDEFWSQIEAPETDYTPEGYYHRARGWGGGGYGSDGATMWYIPGEGWTSPMRDYQIPGMANTAVWTEGGKAYAQMIGGRVIEVDPNKIGPHIPIDELPAINYNQYLVPRVAGFDDDHPMNSYDADIRRQAQEEEYQRQAERIREASRTDHYWASPAGQWQWLYDSTVGSTGWSSEASKEAATQEFIQQYGPQPEYDPNTWQPDPVFEENFQSEIDNLRNPVPTDETRMLTGEEAEAYLREIWGDEAYEATFGVNRPDPSPGTEPDPRPDAPGGGYTPGDPLPNNPGTGVGPDDYPDWFRDFLDSQGGEADYPDWVRDFLESSETRYTPSPFPGAGESSVPPPPPMPDAPPDAPDFATAATAAPLSGLYPDLETFAREWMQNYNPYATGIVESTRAAGDARRQALIEDESRRIGEWASSRGLVGSSVEGGLQTQLSDSVRRDMLDEEARLQTALADYELAGRRGAFDSGFSLTELQQRDSIQRAELALEAAIQGDRSVLDRARIELDRWKAEDDATLSREEIAQRDRQIQLDAYRVQEDFRLRGIEIDIDTAIAYKELEMRELQINQDKERNRVLDGLAILEYLDNYGGDIDPDLIEDIFGFRPPDSETEQTGARTTTRSTGGSSFPSDPIAGDRHRMPDGRMYL